MSFESEMAQKQAEIEAQLRAAVAPGPNFKTHAELLIEGMRSTQKNLMSAFEQFQAGLTKLAAEQGEAMRK